MNRVCLESPIWCGGALSILSAAILACCAGESVSRGPELELVQPELFGASGAQPLAWADFDNDGDLDLYVGFRYTPNRLYRNEGGTFRDVAPEVGLDVSDDTRVAAWAF